MTASSTVARAASPLISVVKLASTSPTIPSSPSVPRAGATRVCQVRRSTRLRAKNARTATLVRTMSSRMLTVARPDIQVNSCSTGSEPATVKTATTTNAVAVCTNQLTYWAGEQLRGAPDIGFDYQHMGLTAAQADALRDLVERARAQGPDLPVDWVPTQARAACTEIAAQPSRTGGPWG